MKEIFKDIKGYEGLYQISNIGRVKSLPKPKRNRSGKWTTSEKILKPSINFEGYTTSALIKNGIAKTKTLHRLVAKAFIPNPENKLTVNHINGIRNDNRVENLEWNTQSENVSHAFRIGMKTQIGSKCPRAILNEKQVLEIRSKFKKRIYTRVMLGKEYGVSEHTIKKVLNKNNWSHI